MNKSFLPETNLQFARTINKKSLSPAGIVHNLFADATRTASGCLISHLTQNAKGYIYVTVGGRKGVKWRAHRLVYSQLKGPIPEGILVCHSCDVRNCIEPEHLFLGTSLDNTKDMIAKNRVARLGRPAIKIETLEETKRLREAGLSYENIAKIQGLSSGTSVMYRLRKLANG